jgi:hypothetical protein
MRYKRAGFVRLFLRLNYFVFTIASCNLTFFPPF